MDEGDGFTHEESNLQHDDILNSFEQLITRGKKMVLQSIF